MVEKYRIISYITINITIEQNRHHPCNDTNIYTYQDGEGRNLALKVLNKMSRVFKQIPNKK